MKKLIFLLLSFVVVQSQAVEIEYDLAQSSPSLNWNFIENDVVRVIYPDSVKSESVYIANLVEHYSHVVGQTYGIAKPHKFNLIIRPEMAQPNAYVTLMPRRSEWFTSSVFIPLVGSSEWFQTLSIHEYRHVNQFDHFNTGATKVLYYIMGEQGWALAAGMTLPSWYLEGDAVWAETKYTDAGRGRSPRFLARLKALVLSNKIPTYDQFLSGSYNTDLPNQYVYGYALVSYATQKYGDNIWEKITSDIAQAPYPLRLYQSFNNVTGQSFADFYEETMNDLRKKWSKDSMTDADWAEYRESSAPFKSGDSLYYVKQTLDSHPQLVRETNGKIETVVKFPYNRDVQTIDIQGDRGVYTEFRPDKRYQQKGTSDLVLIDLKKGSTQKITSNQRLYNPRFNGSANKIVAIEFAQDQSWSVSEFDLNGQRINTFQIKDNKPAEVAYLNDETAVALVNDKTGHKYIATLDLKEKKISRTLLPASRNMISSLRADTQRNIVFEAQYKGYNEVFKLSSEGQLAQCTQSKIASYTPSSDGQNIYVSDEDINGTAIKSVPLSSCKAMDAGELVGFKYLGETASDAYNKFPVTPFADQAELFTKNSDKYQPQEYGDFDKQLLIPNTWGLMIGRGGGFGARTDNYLRTMSLSALAGVDAEESGSFVDFNYDINKYYLLIRFQLENRERKVEDFTTTDISSWTEKTAGVAVGLPYIRKMGLYNFSALLSGQGSYVDMSSYEFNDVSTGDQTDFLYKTGSSLALSWYMDAKPRSIVNPWLLSYRISYEDADAPSNSTLSSFRTLQTAQLNTPAFASNDAFKVTYSQQEQGNAGSSYRFLPESTAISYVFSRGYEYRDVPYFQKVTGNYLFPLAYPDWNLSGAVYAKRLYANLFFDSTYAKDVVLKETMNSYGAEVIADTKILRFFPMSFGARVLQRLEDNMVKGEVFLASDIGF
ncbi:hypothetical protein [Bdellovibrio sp. HCB209]|uniref:hypothetical protein n=1 Tax=Bdellovibrio sp. HCB209 TaxID=3394354 RepID=UPI0039B507B7